VKDYKAILEFLVGRFGGRYRHTLVSVEGETIERFSLCPPDSDEWRTFDSADAALDELVDCILPYLADDPLLLMQILMDDPNGDSPNEGGDE
tara:strand:- start:993 stop:1268 length:276 start_codon:yes stop_codon:yes gene_type:complete